MFDPKARKFSEDELKPQPMIKKSRKVIMKSGNKNDLLLSMVYNFSYFNIHCTAGSFFLSGNSCITMCPSPSWGDIRELFLSCPTIWLKSLYVHLLYFIWALFKTLHFCLFITTWRTTYHYSILIGPFLKELLPFLM